MKHRSVIWIGLLLWAAFSCEVNEQKLSPDKLPYFDVKSFLELQITNLGDSAKVLKTSRINGKEEITELGYSRQDWTEEFDAFFKADINIPALASSYSTETKLDYLIHQLLPDAKGKVKEIKVKYVKDLPAELSFKIEEKNLFFHSVTFGSLYLNQLTQKIDHYTIETTQKVVFLKPTNIKIQGVVRL